MADNFLAMSKISRITAFIVVFLLLQGCGGAKNDPPTNPAKPERPEQLECTVNNGILSFQGKAFELPVMPRDLFLILGDPTRKSHLANTILTWDDMGVYAYLKPEAGRVEAIAIAVGHVPFDFAPKRAFSGKLVIDNVPITFQSTIHTINDANKDNPFKKFLDLLDTKWMKSYPSSSVHIETLDDGRIIDVQIGLKVKGP